MTLTTKEPASDTDEERRYKYSNLACELLTCNVPSLNEKLAGDETLLAKLYSFIDTDEPLNSLLASFFSKTIGVLLTRRSDQVKIMKAELNSNFKPSRNCACSGLEKIGIISWLSKVYSFFFAISTELWLRKCQETLGS